jgi:uncharacterized protein
MSTHAILWRRLDQPGHEAARLVRREGGWELAGSAVFAHQGEPVRLDYVVGCNARWQTGSARIRGWIGSTPVALDLVADDARRWHQNAVECPAVAGCVDLDLAFSPATNLLPIRRLDLAVAEAADVRAAWLEFPTLRLEPLDQRYQRTGLTTYRYESAGGQFQTELEVNAAGFVTRYPELWQAEAAARLTPHR